MPVNSIFLMMLLEDRMAKPLALPHKFRCAQLELVFISNS